MGSTGTQIRPPTVADGMTDGEVARWHEDQAILGADARTAGGANRPAGLVRRVLDDARRSRANQLGAPPMAYPAEPQAQIAFESGWHKATAARLARELADARLEIERLRNVIQDGIDGLEGSESANDVVTFLEGGLR